MCTYDLKNNNYNSNVSDGLQTLLATSDISDITLAVEGRFFKAHQVVLSIFSPYFHELFCVNPSKHTIFFMKNVKYRIMHNLLAFMYEGKVQIPEEDFNLFWETANELKIKGLYNDGEPNNEAQSLQVPVESLPVVGIDAQQTTDANTPILASCQKRPVEAVHASPADETIKKSKVDAHMLHETVPDNNALSSATPSTSWDPAPLECAQEVSPIIVNVTGDSNVQIKEEVDNYSEEDTTHCLQNEDTINLDADATCDVKWEPDDAPVSNLWDPLGNADAGQLGDNELHHGETSKWTSVATTLLISSENELSQKVGHSFSLQTKKKMWVEISKVLEANSYTFTPAQCENKSKTIRRALRRKIKRAGLPAVREWENTSEENSNME